MRHAFRVAVLLAIAVFAQAAHTLIDGHRVYYEVHGRGEPAVVLIHGWTCNSTFWSAQQDALASKYRVITLDLPGHGRSDKPRTEYDLPLFARAVRGVMDADGVKQAVLVGHSMGTAVILQLYTEQPQRVLAIVSADGAVLHNPPESMLKQIEGWASSMRGPSGLHARRKAIESMFTEATTPALRKRISQAMMDPPEHVAVNAFEHMFSTSLWKNPPVIQAPALAINRVSKEAGVRESLEKTFRNLDYHELENTSHFLHMEAPDRFNPLLIAFIDKVKKK